MVKAVGTGAAPVLSAVDWGQLGEDGTGVILLIIGRGWGRIADKWLVLNIYTCSVVGNIATIYSDRKTTRDL